MSLLPNLSESGLRINAPITYPMRFRRTTNPSRLVIVDAVGDDAHPKVKAVWIKETLMLNMSKKIKMYPIPRIPMNRYDKAQIGILSCLAIISAFFVSSSVTLGGKLLNFFAPKFLDKHQ